MKQWVKIVLGLGLFGVAGAVAIGVGGYYWLKGTVDKTISLAPAAQQAGREFGAHATQDGCVDEATRRASDCSSLACEVAEKGFLESCFTVAAVDPKACDGVPKPDELMASVKWGAAECNRRGHAGSQRCQRILSDVQRLCTK